MVLYREGPVKLQVGVIEQRGENPEDDLVDQISLRVILPMPYKIVQNNLENAGWYKTQVSTDTFSYYETEDGYTISILDREDVTTNLLLKSREVRRRNITRDLHSLITLYKRLSSIEGVDWGYSNELEEELYASCNRPFEHKLFTYTDSPQQAITDSLNVWKRMISVNGITPHLIEWGMKEIGNQVGNSLDVALGNYLIGEIEDIDYTPLSTSEINEGLQRLRITRDGWLQDLNLMGYLERTIKEFNLSEVEAQVIRKAARQGIEDWKRGNYDSNII